MKHVIIGGVAGGATAAARIRRIDESCEIVLLEKGKYISYANCGLPYYIGGVIKERENLFLQTPESFGNRFNVDVRVENEAIGINPDEKTLTIKKSNGEEYIESYDKLLLSPGAIPFRPPIEGIDLEGIFTLRNVPDTDAIKNYIDNHSVKKAVVVGAGFIGLEMAENLHHIGASVSIVEKLNQVMPPIDFSMAAMVEGIELTRKSMLDVVAKFGVQVVADIDVPMDPNVHQAIAMVESDDVAAGNVLMVMQKGYTLNGRTIRAAMVSVAKAKG